MENGHGHGHGYGVWRSLRDGDFEEEDVWAVLKERKDSISSIFEPQNFVKRSLPSASRMIRRASTGSTAAAASSNSGSRGVRQQQSAPVTVPDWSKICGKKSNRSFKHHDYDEDDDDEVVVVAEEEEEVEEEEEYNSRVPPHEFIARRLARSQISSFSVFEGAGRTLKGRDLSKMRNAVLTKTGFLE